MNRIISILLFLVVYGCENSTSDKNNSVNISHENRKSIYPLPSSVDSLCSILKTVSDDTNKVNVLIALGAAVMYNDLDSAMIFVNEAKTISEKLKWKKGEANSLGQLSTYYRMKSNYSKAIELNVKAMEIDSALLLFADCFSEKTDALNGLALRLGNLGVIYAVRSDYSVALEYYNDAVTIYESTGDKYALAKQFGNIGNVFKDQGDYPKALEFQLKTLKIAEQLEKKQLQANTLTNIGVIYRKLSDYPKSLDYYLRALEISKVLNNKSGIATNLGNIGLVYSSMGDRSKALDYYSQALDLDRKLGNNNGVARHLTNIGLVFVSQADSAIRMGNKTLAIQDKYPKALENYFEALKINKAMGKTADESIDIGNIGLVYLKTENYQYAFHYLFRALALTDSIGSKDNSKVWSQKISDLFALSTIPLPDTCPGKKMNKVEMRLRSIYYYKQYISIRDTLFSQENRKQLVRKEMIYEFDKKEAITKAENDKKEALAKEELIQKETQRNYFVGGFGLVLILAGFIFHSYRQKQKANEVISKQKIFVEEKQKEILDSIHYAKRIQKSMLPTEKYISKSINRLQK